MPKPKPTATCCEKSETCPYSVARGKGEYVCWAACECQKCVCDIECPKCGGCLIERDHAMSNCPGPTAEEAYCPVHP